MNQTSSAHRGAASVEQRLAEHVTRLNDDQLPERTIERVATFVADTLSVGMAGTAVPEAQSLLASLSKPRSQTAVNTDKSDLVPVWGADQRLPAPEAIMANAFNVHCQEFDCVHEGAVVHAMATLLPVLMAEVQARHNSHRPVNGKELTTAVVAGIDVACTLGLAANNAMRFFRPATAGGFGAVAGLARLRQFDVDQLVAAWGFQLAQTSGTMQGHREGRPVLPLQVSFNARAAWQSCALAQSSLASLDLPLSGECGYLAMFEGDYDIEPLLDTLGQRWRIDELSHKPYPSGRATHAGVEGLLELMRAHELKHEAIASVIVNGPSLISRLVNRPAQPNPSPNYARLCMPYVLAKVMQHGQLQPSHYWPAELADAHTFELAHKVQMTIDDNPDPNAFTPVTVTVALTNGAQHQVTLDHMLASPQRPLSAAQCQFKFKQCCAQAIHPPKQPDHLFHQLMALASADEVAALLHTHQS